MAVEIDRVKRLITQAITEIDEQGGSVRYFNASLMSAAMVLHGNIEGIDSVEAALAKHAQKLVVANTKGGQC